MGSTTFGTWQFWLEMSLMSLAAQTIRRRREAGELPGSVLDEEQRWLIPVENLLAAPVSGSTPPRPPDDQAAPDADGTASDSRDQAGAAELRAELERLRHEHEPELAEERNARALAEAEARHLRELLAERGDHIADLQQALKTLTAAPNRRPSPSPCPRHSPAPVTAAPEPPTNKQGREQEQRRWWSGRG
ncbi:hypothetical protein AB0L14_39545 [Streptomyces sp. NPDC052727]|uniref:hypothetical protein n=1 Tax=Streptomyces sp. NPDC052727 TaxID=3154854 RepID=UPI00341C1595